MNHVNEYVTHGCILLDGASTYTDEEYETKSMTQAKDSTWRITRGDGRVLTRILSTLKKVSFLLPEKLNLFNSDEIYIIKY